MEKMKEELQKVTDDINRFPTEELKKKLVGNVLPVK